MNTQQSNPRDDYIPYPRIEEVLERGGPYPQVILPEFGGYWIEEPREGGPGVGPQASVETRPEAGELEDGGGGGGGDGGGDGGDGGDGGEGGGDGGEERDAYGYHLEDVNDAARAYRKHFLGREHFNFTCTSCSHGNLLLSVRHEDVQEQEYLHVMLRSRAKTVYDRLSLGDLPEIPSIPQLAKLLCDDPAGRFSPVLYPKASQLIVNYDEHEVNNTFKFGVVYQQFGQVSIYLSVTPSICLSVCPSIYLSACLPVYMSVYISIYLSIYLLQSILLPTYPSLCLLIIQTSFKPSPSLSTVI
ncbi:unnamed protein product [Arctogadus glacialis]